MTLLHFFFLVTCFLQCEIDFDLIKWLAQAVCNEIAILSSPSFWIKTAKATLFDSYLVTCTRWITAQLFLEDNRFVES